MRNIPHPTHKVESMCACTHTHTHTHTSKHNTNRLIIYTVEKNQKLGKSVATLHLLVYVFIPFMVYGKIDCRK